jgi:hypothetical protein
MVGWEMENGMGKINQVIGDIYKKVDPEGANTLIIARHISRELGDRKLIICSAGDEAAALEAQLVKLGLKGCEYFLGLADGEALAGKPVKSVEAVMYEDSDGIYLAVIASGTTHRILSRLIEMGYTSEYLHVFCNENIPGGSSLLNVYDANLGFTRVDDMLGFTVFDNKVDETKPVRTMVTLGGSTTDATFANVMSWSEFLQNLLVEQGENVKVLCGGIAAFNSTQELVKCIRDVIPMEPDIVLLYSGLNDVKTEKTDTPFVLDYQKALVNECVSREMVVNNKAYRNTGSDHRLVLKEAGFGLPNNKSIARYWIDNVRMMHAVCQEFGIAFQAFLQPNAYVGKGGELSFHRELLKGDRAEEYKAITLEMAEGIKDIGYIQDLTGIFNGRMEVYMDDCHVLEYGNKIIAEKMLGYVRKLM